MELISALQFRENVAAWVCFHERKDAFKGFLERVLRVKEVSIISLICCIISLISNGKLPIWVCDWIGSLGRITWFLSLPITRFRDVVLCRFVISLLSWTFNCAFLNWESGIWWYILWHCTKSLCSNLTVGKRTKYSREDKLPNFHDKCLPGKLALHFVLYLSYFIRTCLISWSTSLFYIVCMFSAKFP